ncbi:class I SAM-dependent methyltransferase [Hamadaea tsunoensis]|uniref:class I SAM-dependent methyltransferase n=1 Tax=Hamadaea tsunoensis TaxID=53368 RepID=UPI00041E2F08|nr:class I SAM-dependent methyltransferase [Hamadaea tsunoensis]
MTEHALSFGPAAHLYDTIRPTYPRPAIDWAIGPKRVRVLDLGAGTGLLTRVLQNTGHDVVSVDPDERMLAVLATHAGTKPLLGSAERIPLPDGSVDAVMVGQAYHWFTPERALPEIRRVLRPGGVLAPVWNVRDEHVPWVARLSAIVGSEGHGAAGGWTWGETAPWFGTPEGAVFQHQVPMTADGIVDLIRSRSYYLTADPQTRATLEHQVRELLATHPDVAGRETIALPYQTRVFRLRPT